MSYRKRKYLIAPSTCLPSLPYSTELNVGAGDHADPESAHVFTSRNHWHSVANEEGRHKPLKKKTGKATAEGFSSCRLARLLAEARETAVSLLD
ncbi:hypothetical protein C2845_PM18G01170 [Panicum miliaceum]|uniref:Uncharacterized protein n=1 Tax=Panicum miliaceum TaxID=4540 RepID=A0A3L6PJP0_PANMI|nr:hypothetical protein C2845_PM18G01170 [Panicum miliaceum]